MIEVLTYFERKDDTGGQTYCSIIEEGLSMELFMIKPDWIEVVNDDYSNFKYVVNSHGFGEYIKPVEGVNSWSDDNWNHVGVWKIKYKNV